MARWNIYRTTPIGTLDEKDRVSALVRARGLWGEDVRVESVASDDVRRDELLAARKRKFPNRFTDYRGDPPGAA